MTQVDSLKLNTVDPALLVRPFPLPFLPRSSRFTALHLQHNHADDLGILVIQYARQSGRRGDSDPDESRDRRRKISKDR